MEPQIAYSGAKFDRIRFQILRKYDGFVVFRELLNGERLVSSKELGIVYARREDAIRAMDSLVRLAKGSAAGKTVEWND